MLGLVTFWLGGAHPKIRSPATFSNYNDFFYWLCRFGETRLRMHRPIIGQVTELIDPMAATRSGFGYDPLQFEEGYQPLQVRLPARNFQGRIISAIKLGGHPDLVEGDLVGLVPVMHSNRFGFDFWHAAAIAKIACRLGKDGPIVEATY